MGKTILLSIFIGVAAVIFCGCGPSDSAGPSTAQEKKAFAGGEMPAAARKEFEDSQKKSAAIMADRIAKAKADAAAGNH